MSKHDRQKTKLHHEICRSHTMISYPSFIKKLQQIENVCSISNINRIRPEIIAYDKLTKPECDDCLSEEYYLLGNILWGSIVKHIITNHNIYPSEYFVNVILASDIANNIIINPPLLLNNKIRSPIKYIPLHRNKLLILDALMNQGSFPRYQNGTDYLFSEHSGVITVKDNVVDDIIVFTNTDRTDKGDDRIFLPNNTIKLSKYKYLFHTHPNTLRYGGRVKEGILYEFPSAGDIFNYIKYHIEGKALSSIVISPEGAYVIRQLTHSKRMNVDSVLFHQLKDFIIILEKRAIKKYIKDLKYLSDSDFFHKKIGSDYEFINIYNQFISPLNLLIEYYPREKVNGEWSLRQFYLQYF